VTRTALVLLAAAFALVAGAPGRAEDAPPPAKPIFLDIAPADLRDSGAQMPGDTAVTAPGVPVRISGFVAREAGGAALTVTVTPPQEPEPYAPDPEPDPDAPACPARDEAGDAATVTDLFRAEPPTEIAATVATDGRFDVEFTPTAEGEHEVEVADAAGLFRGESSFEVVTLEAQEDCKDVPQDEIEAVAADLSKAVCDAADAVAERIEELPPSPQKDEATRRLEAFRAELDEGLPCGSAPPWVNAAYHVGQIRKVSPEMRRATSPVLVQIEDWLITARKARDEAPRAIAEITRGNVACDQLDIIVNGLKFVDFYLGLIVKPADFLADWAKENVPTKLVSMIPAVGQTPAVKDAVELGWKGVTSYKPKREAGRIRIGAEGFDLSLTHAKMTNGVLAYVASRIFEALCQTFQGPVTGRMSADFLVGSRVWWHYDIEISGQLTLRYPKNAKGEAIALTGEFLGNATRLKSWDNAIPVLYPELAQGTVFRTLRVEPIALDSIPGLFGKNLGLGGGSAVPDFNPVKSTIDQGGAIAQFVMTPAFFRVPVKGELRETTLRLELLPPARDFDDLRVKVVSIILPVLSLWPDVIDYALPYKGAHFIMTRAMNDGPYTFDVERAGETMTIAHVFTREKETAETRGVYALTVKACNPGC
jgi:hypothetical protein